MGPELDDPQLAVVGPHRLPGEGHARFLNRLVRIPGKAEAGGQQQSGPDAQRKPLPFSHCIASCETVNECPDVNNATTDMIRRSGRGCNQRGSSPESVGIQVLLAPRIQDGHGLEPTAKARAR